MSIFDTLLNPIK